MILDPIILIFVIMCINGHPWWGIFFLFITGRISFIVKDKND